MGALKVAEGFNLLLDIIVASDSVISWISVNKGSHFSESGSEVIFFNFGYTHNLTK